ncbi:ninjurin-2 isoform X1 [Cryptotermes secundus]|uniref:ninjurin-2 isoform X1 n=1 Tax=Cryptotermes secundus TaxID=105785 RepID=UPI000CD7BB50|nr:ninjurin-2 isoform X1 [Cryptotermes secundus]
MSTAAITPEMGGRGKTLDANSYATKKTIAQGMLDIALLTANASQLKYVLQLGHQHEFYTLMVWLISISIVLQACQGVLYVMLGSSFNINKSKDQRAANVWNNVVLAMGIVTTILNVIISAFDMRETDMVGFNSTTTPSAPSQ